MDLSKFEPTDGTDYILVSCGCFSPITIMHTLIFEQIRNSLQSQNISVIGGILSPAHDSYAKKGLIPFKFRKEMCEMAIKDSEWITVSDWEGKQEKWIETAKVLKYHKEELDKHFKKSIKLLLIGGTDLIDSFLIPNIWSDVDMEYILSQCGMAIIERLESSKFSKTEQYEKYKNNIFYIRQAIQNNISSSVVRELLSNKLSIRYLVNRSVEDYIKKNDLYRKN